jgi:hypothetical protein
MLFRHSVLHFLAGRHPRTACGKCNLMFWRYSRLWEHGRSRSLPHNGRAACHVSSVRGFAVCLDLLQRAACVDGPPPSPSHETIHVQHDQAIVAAVGDIYCLFPCSSMAQPSRLACQHSVSHTHTHAPPRPNLPSPAAAPPRNPSASTPDTRKTL